MRNGGEREQPGHKNRNPNVIFLTENEHRASHAAIVRAFFLRRWNEFLKNYTCFNF